MPVRQSDWSTSDAIAGRVVCERPGKTALATAAALATASLPPTRVVFFVASAGKPSTVSLTVSFLSRTSTGVRWSDPQEAGKSAPSATASAMKRLDLVLEGAIGAATIAATAGRKCRMERAKP